MEQGSREKGQGLEEEKSGNFRSRIEPRRGEEVAGPEEM